MDVIKGWVQSDFPAFAGKAVTFERCYSMAESGDGGVAEHFMKACANIGPTVTVIKSHHGHIFGGATDTSWDLNSGYHEYGHSDVAFLFCIECFVAGAGGPYSPHQMHITDPTKAIFPNIHSGKGVYGPTFGNGHDLHISDTPGAGASGEPSMAWLGKTYACPVGNYGDTACENYFDGPGTGSYGTRKFEVDDYEVFVLKAT